MRTVEEELMRKRQQLEEKEREETDGYIRVPHFGFWVIAAAAALLLAGGAVFLLTQG